VDIQQISDRLRIAALLKGYARGVHIKDWGPQEQPGVAAEEPGHLMSVHAFGHRTEKKMNIKMLHAVFGVVYSARKHS
jgi:hypothetical protein